MAPGLGQRSAAAARTVSGQGMFLVTGGAGFIGSNLVARLNEAGHGDVAVCDHLGSEGKWRNLQKRRLADFVPPADLLGLAVGPQARSHLPHGRDLGDHRDRRRPRHRDQFPPAAAAARLVHCHGHAVHLCVVGRDLWRRRGRLCRRQFVGSPDAAQADESLWLEQAPVRSRRDRARTKRRQPAAAMGRA